MARYVKVRRQGRMVWLDKETGKTSVKKPTTPTTTTPKNKTPTKTSTTSSSGGSSSYNKNIKWLKDAALRQQASGAAPRIKPGKTQLGTALTIGAAIGEAYKRTNRAPAVSNRGEGRATFTEKKKTEEKKTETKTTDKPKSTPRKVKYPVQIGKVEEKPKNTSSSSSSSSSGSSGGSSSSSSSSSTPPRRKPPTAPPPVPKGIVEKTADRYKAKAKKVKDRKAYLQTKEGGGLSKRMSEALADKDALKFKSSEDKPKRKPNKDNRSKWRR